MTADSNSTHAIAELMDGLGQAARAASRTLALAAAEQRDKALRASAEALRDQRKDVLQANRTDLEAATQRGLSAALLDRLMLDEARIESVAAGLEAIAELPDPLGRVTDERERPNGLRIQRVTVPIGVLGIIYESRPNVTADAAGLCIKSGNASILRGGSESLASNTAIHDCMRQGLAAAGLDVASVQLVPLPDRDAVGYLLSSMREWVDVVVPRGGRGLIERVQKDARVPVIGHLEGICHVYLHASAEPQMAREVVFNAKMRRTGICGAAETILVDEAAAPSLLPAVLGALRDAGCEIRGDERVQSLFPEAVPAVEADWSAEYLDAIIAVRAVPDIAAAIAHIGKYGSGHTESIIAADPEAKARFFREVDSAILLHNASTQFADGSEFGMGAEIGIATGRIHARGPVGANELTSYKYLVHGDGQVRG